MALSNLSLGGVLVVSIDAEATLAGLQITPSRALDSVVSQLLGMLSRLEIPATFAVSDPMHSAATEGVVASPIGHELALLGEPTWSGGNAGRPRFARELARRVHSARAAGLAIDTFVPAMPRLDDHSDLLVKHGLSALRCDADNKGALVSPRQLRYGLWEIPVSSRLPAPKRLFRGRGGATARRGIGRAVANGGLYHLAIDAARLSCAGPAAHRMLEFCLGRGAILRDRSRIKIFTLGEVASLLAQPRSTKSATSILRKAG